MGAYVFRKALIRTMADIQAAEIDSHCQGNAFFQSARDCSHERSPRSCANWEDGCRDENDTAIIRLELLAMAKISDPRWHRLPKGLLDYPRLRRLREQSAGDRWNLDLPGLRQLSTGVSSDHGWQPVL